eukprot:3462384-Rhodomonas_salina.1
MLLPLVPAADLPLSSSFPLANPCSLPPSLSLARQDPELFLFDVREGGKYRLAGTALTFDAMSAHVKEFEAGTAKPFLKSAPVIDGWDAEPVKAIVASQWEDFTKQVAPPCLLYTSDAADDM